MQKISLNGTWQMTGAGYSCSGTIPGSVYSFLLDNHLMEDPFYRQNELEALKLMEHEFTFTRSFQYRAVADSTGVSPVFLHCDGLDTLCDIYLNHRHVACGGRKRDPYSMPSRRCLSEGKAQSTRNSCHHGCLGRLHLSQKGSLYDGMGLGSPSAGCRHLA